ncbi:hypothetical protein LELG_03289 [Lodderomyces elongisporus NRRL YB-4239]|uniref:Long-chain-alcohol oxidase n=1 Tax=Lodderomyces elongisporus (strain ATCC 11503 / CBS 2605 / JCM 1781 / NBRC 1676 / NRRL YB-4239) TaxID=379508 RepID=A5E102_LODEL|nr:hypothetical protein LELG_03289 [Lodderomyces elongisporus NRRL YB-4239]
MSTFLPDVATMKHVETFACLSDGIIHDAAIPSLKEVVNGALTEEELEVYTKRLSRPSQIPEFKNAVLEIINHNTTQATQLFIILMTALDSRILAPTLTNSITLVKDMDLKQREALIASLRDSPISAKRKLFRLVCSLTLKVFASLGDELHNKAIHYPGKSVRESAYDGHVVDPFRYEFVSKPQFDGAELYLPDIDVIIIGSGAGAGVVAHTLANDGFKSLILEKGKYFLPQEYVFDDCEGMQELYQSEGVVTTTNSQLFILAGSTFGGGTTVNWSACLKTPFKVRKEWYDDYGLDFAATDTYDKCQDYVWKQMGASTEGITHSLANEVVIEGGKKLGYKSKEIDQNSGGHPHHPCGFCFLGCRYGIKQGSAVNWFRDAAARGSKFMQQVRVLQIIHKNGVATGLLCQDEETGTKFKITGPKKFVVSAGSLNTPVVLQNSGFKNKHIGKNLTLHPVTTVFGDFGQDVQANHSDKSIMTSVCTQVDDLDGKAHGAKIETILNTPAIQAAFLPWRGSDETRKDLLRYNQMCAMLLITRDTSTGSVKVDPNRPESLYVDYTVSKFDKNALLQAMLITSDMLYIEGAKRILSPQPWVPVFESDTPKEKRSIKDQDYVEWRAKVAKIPLDDYGTPYGSAHQMSSCRMSGKGPKYGACDTKGRLFEASNIYIADASCLPTASGANPMITTMAISRHVALELCNALKTKPKL